jgi:hypothetical protein
MAILIVLHHQSIRASDSVERTSLNTALSREVQGESFMSRFAAPAVRQAENTATPAQAPPAEAFT